MVQLKENRKNGAISIYYGTKLIGYYFLVPVPAIVNQAAYYYICHYIPRDQVFYTNFYQDAQGVIINQYMMETTQYNNPG